MNPDKKLTRKLKKIVLFATDFDGVHTDGKVYVDQNGIESVHCSRRDGLGYNMLSKAGIHSCIISKEANLVVKQRCKKLNIACYQKIKDGHGKVEILKDVMKKFGLDLDQVLFMGDDVNDYQALKFAGVAIAVKDCHPSLLKIVDYRTKRVGGDHAIREVAELILKAKGLSISF